jgi:iron complex outermembrane recepter protein
MPAPFLSGGFLMSLRRPNQDVPRVVFTAVALSLAAAGLLHAQDASRARPATVARDSVQRLRTVEVVASRVGRGKTRAGSAVDPVDLQLAPIGTSALKVVERLPGVNMQSADPFGTYEWSNRITMRGFQTQQIGQTFDGITLGDMSYGNFNGLGIGRAIDADNLGGATVLQGSGALGTASSNNLGGVVQYTSGDPFGKRTLSLSQLVGEANTRRTAGRFDTGLLTLGASSGIKAFVSLSRIDNDKWKGSGTRASPAANVLFGTRGGPFGLGETWQDQVNAKVQYFAGPHQVVAYYGLSDRTESDYTDLSLARWRSSGRDWDQFSNWTQAVTAAGSNTPDEAYYNTADGLRRDHLAYLKGTFRLSQSAKFEVQPYLHTNRGAGDWTAPSYGASWSPDPIYFRQTQYDSKRYGTNAKLTLDLPGNELEVGGWYESNESHIRRVGWRLTNYSAGPAVDFTDVLRLFFDRTGQYSTSQAYVQNTNRLLHGRLKLTYGVKVLHIGADFNSNGRTIASAATLPDSGRPNFSIPTNSGILPQAGAVFSATENDEFFANVSENVNALPYSPQSGVYNTSPAAFQFFKDNTNPERATTIEGGYRMRRGPAEASLTVFNVAYRNRLIGVAVCPLTATCVSSFANVGGVTSRGAEGLLSVRLLPGLSLTTSAAFTNATINDNYVSGAADTVKSKGKKVVDTPRLLGNAQLRFAHAGLVAQLGGRYVAERYFSILNSDDGKVPAYTTLDANAEYTLRNVPGVRELSFRVNALNLTDENYIGTIGTGGFTRTGDTQTLLSGARRLLFVSIGTRF